MSEHHHLWGPMQRSAIAGTAHRKCAIRGCTVILALDDDEAYDMLDKFGRWWPEVDWDERCDECGQPDNCGDCNHTPYNEGEVALLGGIIPRLDGTDVYAY